MKNVCTYIYILTNPCTHLYTYTYTYFQIHAHTQQVSKKQKNRLTARSHTTRKR